jgi:predicted lipoprotein with Yx(FWY)xxD motif
MKLISIPAAAVALALAVAGCGGGSSSSSSSTTAKQPSSATKTTASGATVDVRKSDLGTMLTDSTGRTLYLFEKDKGTASTCYGSCASAWPPLTTSAAPKAGTDVKASALGTTKRKDGTSEVTYNGHPLYYYVGDGSPGSTTGQGLDQFGAEWYVLAPSGNKIDHDS